MRRRIAAGLLLLLIALLFWRLSGPGPDALVPPVPPPADEPTPPPARVVDEERPAAHAVPADDRPLAMAGTVHKQDGIWPAKLANLLWAQAGTSAEVTVADDGKFRIEGLRAGDVRLIVTPNHDIDGAPVDLMVAAGSEDLAIVLAKQNAIGLDIADAATGRTVRTWVHVIGICRMGEFTLSLQEGGLGSDVEYPTVRPDDPLSLRVEAEGYRPSAVREVSHDPDVVFQTVRIALEPDPANVAVLVLHPRFPDGEAPGRVTVLRHVGGQSVGRPRDLDGGTVELTVPPGENDVEVWPGRRRPPWWVPVRFRVDLTRKQLVQKEVVFVRGGILVVQTPERDAAPRVEVFRDGRRVDVHRKVEEQEGEISLRFGPMSAGTWIVRGKGYRDVKVGIQVGQVKIVELQKKK
ncbi:MAG: hypothetical protein ABFS86_07250 [Planctomycetota bacterium]